MLIFIHGLYLLGSGIASCMAVRALRKANGVLNNVAVAKPTLERAKIERQTKADLQT
jgi:hypothetical protein